MPDQRQNLRNSALGNYGNEDFQEMLPVFLLLQRFHWGSCVSFPPFISFIEGKCRFWGIKIEADEA